MTPVHLTPTSHIFVRALSRSGGTLVCSVLDAHGDVSMSYEIYQHLLRPPSTAPGFYSGRAESRFLKSEPVAKFINRACRSGLSRSHVEELIRNELASEAGLSTFESRMNVVIKICEAKRDHFRKTISGCKVASEYYRISELLPGAKFVYVVRDGRDVAASQMVRGSFRKSFTQIADGWQTQYRNFRKLQAGDPERFFLMKYEALVDSPETSLRDLISGLGLNWDAKVLRHDLAPSTLRESPMGHLSAADVTRPINSSSVGRWRKNLSSEAVEEFEKRAGDSLRELGYLT